jgi:hypothetical protein
LVAPNSKAEGAFNPFGKKVSCTACITLNGAISISVLEFCGKRAKAVPAPIAPKIKIRLVMRILVRIFERIIALSMRV